MFDLHVHTTASDGELDSVQIIEEAIKNNVFKLAITDHDTFANVKECVEYGKKRGVIVIPGIEVSAEVEIGQMHILGLGIDINNKELNSAIDFFINARKEKNSRTLETLKKEFGIELKMEEIQEIAKTTSLGRPHFAKLIVKKGYAKSVPEAFDKYLSKPCIEDIKRKILKPKETIEIINNAGGIAVLAHPYSLKLNNQDTYKKIIELKSYGLGGIEAYHSNHTPEQAELYKSIAEKEGLLITCGSDFHGKNVKPNIELGKGKNSNLPTDNDEIFDKLYNKLMSIKNEKC